MSEVYSAKVNPDGTVEAQANGEKLIICETAELSAIETGLRQLCKYRDQKSSPNPVELEWEIKLYEFILNSPDSKDKAAEYMRVRYEGGNQIPKREVARKLGWEI